MSNGAQANGGKLITPNGETKMAVYSQKSADLIERNLTRHGFASVSVIRNSYALCRIHESVFDSWFWC